MSKSKTKRSTIIKVIANPCDGYFIDGMPEVISVKQFGGTYEGFTKIGSKLYFPIWVVNPQYLIIRNLNH